MVDNAQVPRNLKHYFPQHQVIQGSVSGEDKEVNNFLVKTRFSTKWSLVLASVEANDKKTSEKIAMISDKINEGVLLLLRFGVYSKETLVTFKTKTIIVTGNIFVFLN
jgi:hypothetical protein